MVFNVNGCFGQRAALSSRRLVKWREALWGHNFSRDNQADGASMTHHIKRLQTICRRFYFWLRGGAINPKLVFLDQRVEDR